VTTGGLVFSVVGFVALTAGGWLGGAIVFVHGVRVLARDAPVRVGEADAPSDPSDPPARLSSAPKTTTSGGRDR
jgi:hypothetical protein